MFKQILQKKLKIVIKMVISHCIIISGESYKKNDFCVCFSHKEMTL